MKNNNKLKLIESKELLTYLINNKYHKVKIVKNPNKILRGKSIDNLLLVIAPSKLNNPKSKNEREFIGKVSYIAREQASFLQYVSAETLFNHYFTSSTIIVRVRHDLFDFYIEEVGNSKFITVNYSEFYKLFEIEPSILLDYEKLVFVFDEITWEGLQILFASVNIKLIGVSKNKRYLLNPFTVEEFWEGLPANVYQYVVIFLAYR